MLDLKKFKKVSEDKNSATLQHPKGHKITVIVSKLSPIEKEALRRLDMCAPERMEKGRKQYKEGSKDEPVSPTDSAPLQSPQQPAASTEQIPSETPEQGQQNPSLINGSTVTDVANPLPAIGQEQAAIKGQAAIDAQKAAAQANFEDEYMKAKQQNMQQDQRDVLDVKKHADAFDSYLQKNPINEKQFFENMSVPTKIVSGLGMVFSGLNPQVQANAMNFLNRQIDRNVDAQKARFEQQRNVFGAYHQLYGDQVIATKMTKIAMKDYLVHQSNQMAARLGTQQAQVTAQKLAAEKAIERQQLLIDSAGRMGALRKGVATPEPAGISATEQPSAQGAQGAQEAPSEQTPPSNYGVMSEAPPGAVPNASAAMQQPAKEAPPEHVSILNPNSENLYKRLAYTPKAKDQYGDITKQYNQAVQSEKAMKAIEDKFPQLREEATLSGNVAEHLSPHAVAAAGAAVGMGLGVAGSIPFTAGLGAIPAGAAGSALGATIGEGAGHGVRGALGVLGGQQQVQYEADKAALTKVIAAALRGTNVSSDQIQDVVDSNTPSFLDRLDPKTYKKKIKNIQDFIKQNTETGLLKTWNLTKE